MKTKRLLERIGEVLSGEAGKKRREAEAVKKLCARLRVKEEELEQRRADADDPEKAAKLARKIALLKAQREKGEALVEEKS